MLDREVHIVASVASRPMANISRDALVAAQYRLRPKREGTRAGSRAYSQPIWRPLFCSSSQLISGLKYSIIARVEMSSPVASFKTLRQSSVPPFFKILFSQYHFLVIGVVT